MNINPESHIRKKIERKRKKLTLLIKNLNSLTSTIISLLLTEKIYIFLISTVMILELFWHLILMMTLNTVIVYCILIIFTCVILCVFSNSPSICRCRCICIFNCS